MNIFINSKKSTSGQVMLVLVVIFLFVSMAIVFGVINPILKQVAITRSVLNSQESFYLAESSLEEVLYRIKSSKQFSSTETLSLNGGTANTTITDIIDGKRVISVASKNFNYRSLRADLLLGTGISFHYGIQSGQGGFILQNTSSIVGNVFSAGTVTGYGNYVYGDVISSGASGLIDGVHATGTARSHNIKKTTSNPTIIDGDAYYVNKDAGVVVNGTSYPGSVDQPLVDLPISDDQIFKWESDALAGGVMTSNQCDSYSSSTKTCTITTNKTIGPIKIPFNLLIKCSSCVVTVSGPVWIAGDLTTQTGPIVKMATSLGNKNVAIISHDPTATSTKGIINIGQSTIFQNSGSSGSFIFLMSMNNSAETGGTTDAIILNQGASAMVAYASHGQVTLSQSVNIKEVTAYRIILQNSAQVVYDKGLPTTLFQTGPSGGYAIISWKEIK